MVSDAPPGMFLGFEPSIIFNWRGIEFLADSSYGDSINLRGRNSAEPKHLWDREPREPDNLFFFDSNAPH